MLWQRVKRHFPCLIVGVLLLHAPEKIAAQENPDAACYQGEYVLSVSSVRALRSKAVAAFKDVADTGIVELSKESPRALLIRTDNDAQVTSKRALVMASRADDICQRLRRKERRDRARAARLGVATIVRDVTCSCNAKVSAVLLPNDQHFGLEWGLHQSNDVDMDVPEAWEITSGSSSVVVAVVDSGVDFNHPDLTQNMWRNPGEIAGNGIDDDANGYVDDVHGINAITRSGNPMDDHGHGTHVAGTISARTNNGIGVAGVTWNSKIMGIKFLGANGSGSLYDAVVALDYVTLMRQRGTNVVLSNNSWGGSGSTWGPLRDAILRHQNAGMLFVAAAGNNGTNNDSSPFYPSNTDLESVISVAAIDQNGNKASFSNYGVTSVDVAAPGVNIASTYPNNAYQYMSGTSMAAPNVSGVLALAASYSVNSTWQQLKAKLMSSSVPRSSLSGVCVTGAVVNAYNMLVGLPVGPTPTPTIAPTSTPTPIPTSTPTPLPTMTPTPTIPPGNYALSGTVRVNGRGVGGAAVVVSALGGVRFERTTADDGSYSFNPGVYGPQDYSISVRKPGHYFSPQSFFHTRNRVIDFDGSLANSSVTAYVRTASNQPVAGIQIDAGDLGSGVTNSQGIVQFTAPYLHHYTLRARASTTYIFNKPELAGASYGNVGRVFVAEAISP